MSEEILSSVNAEPAGSVEPQNTEQTTETVSSENVEVAEPQQTEKPVQTPEENAKFAEQRRAREAAETKAATLERDYSIAKTYGKDYEVYSESDIAEKYGHLGITTLDQFKEAVRIEEMKANGIDPEQYKKYVEEDPEVREAREWKQQQSKNAEYNEFFDYFKAENGRDFNSTTDIIPDEVWQMTHKGKTLTDAYTYHYAQQLKAKIAELEGKKKAEETNAANAASSTGSLTGNGGSKDTTLTPEMIENMTDKERISRWAEIKKVMGMK